MAEGAEEEYLANLEVIERENLSINIPFSTIPHAKSFLEVWMKRDWKEIRVCLDEDGGENSLHYNNHKTLIDDLTCLNKNNIVIKSIKISKEVKKR